MGTFSNGIWWCGDFFFDLTDREIASGSRSGWDSRLVYVMRAIALSQKGCHVKVHSDFKTEDRKAGKCPLEHPDIPYTNS
jgi:hypothetical protein